VREAVDGTELEAGTVYVAPSGRHLRIIAGRTLSLTDTAPVRFSRPSADVLLGSLADAGVPMVAVLAQNRATSLHFGMPGAAVDAGGVDQALPLDAIAPRLVELIDTLHAACE
jgi:two-component system chemotaxis response regulator CheB